MNRHSKESRKYITSKLEQTLEDRVGDIKEIIMDGYDGLSVKVSDPKSKTNPEMFRDKFEENLDGFSYLYKSEDTTKFTLPTVDNFNFTGIPTVECILEGTVGTFVEISHEDLVKLTGKSTINEEPIDPSATKQKRVYLVKYDDKVRRGEKNILKKKLIKFSFSNTPPLDTTVFGPAEEYVDSNIEKWVDGVVKTGAKEISQKYGTA